MKLSEKINDRLRNLHVGYNGWMHPKELQDWAKDAEHLEQRWISVEERLPAPLEPVAILRYGEFFIGRMAGTEPVWWRRGALDEWHRISHVTHWISLPAPPSTATHT